jgi:hypothetical protein
MEDGVDLPADITGAREVRVLSNLSPSPLLSLFTSILLSCVDELDLPI